MGEIKPLVPVRIMPAQGSVARLSAPLRRSTRRGASMNANDKFYARDAHVDEAAVAPLPNSRKIYVTGSRPDLRSQRPDVTQSDTPASFGTERTPAIYVYDTSGPYTDPQVQIDIRSGLAPLR